MSPDYSIIAVAFATPQSGTDYNMAFTPDQVTQTTLISQIQTLQSQGKKVIISIGGATAPVSLDNTTEKNTFISSMLDIINTYGFEGMDIDLEGSSLSLSGGTISSPVDAPIINLIDAIDQIMDSYYTSHGHQMILTMAPETAYVQGGQSAYGSIWGAYLPVIDALRHRLTLLHVQLYNSGSMYGIDGGIYYQGTADFIIAMTEAVIQGFNTSGGYFAGLPANKVAVGLPACSLAAGGGFVDTSTVASAINYLRGLGPKPGAYTLSDPLGYPDLGGMMTWSINWDASATCNTVYEFSANYTSIFGTQTNMATPSLVNENIYLDPATNILHIGGINVFSLQVLNPLGQLMMAVDKDVKELDLSRLRTGFYVVKIRSDHGTAGKKIFIY